LLPFFPPIRRIRTGGILCKRCFDYCTIHALPLPCDTFHIIVFGQSCAPKGQKEPRFEPLSKVLVYGACTSKAFSGESLPLTPSPQYKDDTFKHSPGGHGLAATTELSLECPTWFSFPHRHKRFYTLPELIGYFPRPDLRHVHLLCEKYSIARDLKQFNYG
jgi:hypothetical protein